MDKETLEKIKKWLSKEMNLGEYSWNQVRDLVDYLETLIIK